MAIIDLRDSGRRERALSQGVQNIVTGLSMIENQKARERALQRQQQLDKLQTQYRQQQQALQLLSTAATLGTTPEMLLTPEGQNLALKNYQQRKEKQKSFERGLKEREVGIKEQKLALGRKKPKEKIKTTEKLDLSPGQLQLDKEFAKDFNEFEIQGKFADAEKGINQLEEVSKALEKKDDITGPAIGAIPDFIRKRVLPESSAIQQSVEEVVQRNLRLILGAQFTEKEGQRLIERAFDPSLSEAENKKRVDRLLTQMKTALDAKKSAGQHFKRYGTLKGFKGPVGIQKLELADGKQQQEFMIPSAQADNFGAIADPERIRLRRLRIQQLQQKMQGQ